MNCNWVPMLLVIVFVLQSYCFFQVFCSLLQRLKRFILFELYRFRHIMAPKHIIYLEDVNLWKKGTWICYGQSKALPFSTELKVFRRYSIGTIPCASLWK